MSTPSLYSDSPRCQFDQGQPDLIRETSLCRTISGMFSGMQGTPLFFQGWLPCGTPEFLLLMVHGLGSHGGTFWPWARSLVNRGIGIYALDLRGHGRSAGKPGFVEDWSHFRHDLREFVQRIRDDHADCPYFMFGHSLGGTILLDYLLKEADQPAGAVLMAPALSLKSVPLWKRRIAQLLSQVWPDFSLENGFQTEWGTRDPAMALLIDRDELRHAWGSARLGTEYFQTVEEIMQLAPQLRTPTLILHGEADRIVETQASETFFHRLQLPDKTRWIYPQGRHDLHMDLEREQVVADIECWLSLRRSLAV